MQSALCGQQSLRSRSDCTDAQVDLSFRWAHMSEGMFSHDATQTSFRVVFNEVVQTTKDFMRDVTVINPDWLCELAPDFYQFGTVSSTFTTLWTNSADDKLIFSYA